MHARSTLVHAARARAAPPFDPCRRVRGTRAPPCPAAPTDGRLVRVTRRVTSPPKQPPSKQPPHILRHLLISWLLGAPAHVNCEILAHGFRSKCGGLG
eukprot:scaffold7572_cov55-Phaeocystis_antarctica.AAC.4